MRKSEEAEQGRKAEAQRGTHRTKPEQSATAGRVARILNVLADLYPGATTELQYRTPFELLVATILSAQCTDERVNRVTPELFARYPDAAALARARLPDVEAIIRSTGFYKNKACHIVAMSQMLVERFGGTVPHTMEEIVSLPGVARKTANVVLGTAFGIAEGIVVDTHVRRLAERIGLSTAADPETIEQDLMRLIPRERWIEAGHLLILHGRRVCTARKPKCEACAVRTLCPSG